MIHIPVQKRKRSEVPIIPLIDILAILLIFFIVTTTFKEKKTNLQIELPTTTSLLSSETTDRRIPVSITPDGAIYFGDQLVDAEGLESRLVELKASGAGADKLEIKADAGSELGTLVEVWDVLTRTGFPIRDVPARIRKAPQE